MPEDVKPDDKPEEQVVPPTDPSTVVDPSKVVPPAEGVKTDDKPKETVKPDPAKPEDKKPNWQDDPRFQEFIKDKNTLKELQSDPDFAAFLAFKKQKDGMAQAGKEKKPDYANMTAEEYADHVATNAEKRADTKYNSLVEANKEGDRMSAEVVSFAGEQGIDKDTFQKDYAPKIVEYYNKVAKNVPPDAMDALVKSYPPKEVFKSLFFGKAGEAGVAKYKQDIEKAKGAEFEPENAPSNNTVPNKDFRGNFDKNWNEIFGNAETLPQSALDKK